MGNTDDKNIGNILNQIIIFKDKFNTMKELEETIKKQEEEINQLKGQNRLLNEQIKNLKTKMKKPIKI